ncbi:50S ribosomal protein L33 [Hypoxylon argillaceum]|nr:50S ribosomal protein L33 [Hypoxylon argillaceum]
MAKKAKSRMISVRLLSMAMTGFFYQYSRPRTTKPMSMLKYDPVGTSSCFHVSVAIDSSAGPF